MRIYYIVKFSALRMPYIHAIILETMRHAPFIPSLLPRRVSEDTECAGYKIPKGTLLLGFLYPVFHDKSFWGDPEVFRPERFLLPSGSLDSSRVERFVQFGFGKLTAYTVEGSFIDSKFGYRLKYCCFVFKFQERECALGKAWP